MRFLALVQCADVGLKLGMRCCRVAATIANIGPLASVGAFVIVFGLVGGKGLVAASVAAGVGTVSCVAEHVTGKFGALLEVFRAGFTAFPLAVAVCAVVDVGGFDVFVEGFGRVEEGEAEDSWSVLPGWMLAQAQ